MAYRDERARRKADAARVLAQHTMKPSISRSFYFRSADPKMGSSYAFALTWRPGSLVLSGDCGELTLTHYHALSDFEGGMSWAIQGDFDYLLEKSDKKREYDPEGTKAFVLADLNRGAIEARRDELQERRRHRGRVAEGQAEFRAAHDDWLLSRQDEEPVADDYVPGEFDDTAAYTFSRKCDWRDRWLYGGVGRGDVEISDYWHVPDGWEPWTRAWRVEQGYYYPDSTVNQPDAILSREKRRHVWEELENHFDDQHTAVDLLYKLGFDDYHGDYHYTSHALFQIAVIQHGVRMILAAEPEAQEQAA